MTTVATKEKTQHTGPWVSWLLGAALLAAVIISALHFTDTREFVNLLKRAQPWWVAVAIVLQAATYLAQGGVWGRVAARCGYSLPPRTAVELSFAKLFFDQALPSAGLSSSVFTAKALEQRQVPDRVVKASVLVNIASYQLAYVIALIAALAISIQTGQRSVAILVTSVVFLAFSAALCVAVLALAGRRHERLSAALRKIPAARKSLEFLAGSDGALVRSARLLTETTALQEVIVVLDVATLWVLILALGQHASVPGVFASFMISSLFRTMGVVPGGLGTFEATSVLTLRMIGVDLAVALSATLLFRGFTFWLPMLPGYWSSRRVLKGENLLGG
jgi:uncharacterized protein (TIRG00374 family)